MPETFLRAGALMLRTGMLLCALAKIATSPVVAHASVAADTVIAALSGGEFSMVQRGARWQVVGMGRGYAC